MHILLDQLKDITAAIMYAAQAPDVESVLERIAQTARQLTGTKYVALGVPDGRDGLRYFKVAGMTEEEGHAVGHLPKGYGLIGAIMRERKPIRLERMADDSRSAGFCANHPPMTSLLGVPIQIGTRLFGVLYLCDREDGQPFTEEDEHLVEVLASYAALTIAGAQLGEQQSRIRLLEERDRIGMELHDGVIQSLYALGMHLDLLRQNQSAPPNELTQVIGGLNNVIEDIRRYIMNLRRSETQPITVRECMSSLLERLHVSETVQVLLSAPDDPPPFSPSAFEGICLIVNEALSNSMRHAEASHIQIDVSQIDHTFLIILTDNGRGFDVDEARSQGGLGLSNMQQRARLYGGAVDIESAPGQGTRLTIRIPISYKV